MQLVKVQTSAEFENRNESERRKFLLTFKQYFCLFWDGMRINQRKEWSSPGQKRDRRVPKCSQMGQVQQKKTPFLNNL